MPYTCQQQEKIGFQKNYLKCYTTKPQWGPVKAQQDIGIKY